LDWGTRNYSIGFETGKAGISQFRRISKTCQKSAHTLWLIPTGLATWA